MKFDIKNGVLHKYYPEGNETEVVIPEGVTSIGEAAFGKGSFKKVTIPDSVEYIEDGAFVYCRNLESVNIPDGVVNIGENTFYSCSSLKEITIPESVTEIGDSAFLFCSSLESIFIPASVTKIGFDTFGECPCAEINISENNKTYAVYDGVLYNKSFDKLLYCPSKKEKIKFHKNLKRIISLENSQIKKLIIPEGVELIYGMNLSSVVSIDIPKTCYDICFWNVDFGSLKNLKFHGVELKVAKYKKSLIEEATELIMKRDYSVKMQRDVKYPVVCAMYFADVEGAFEYVKKNFTKIMTVLIENNESDTIKKLTAHGNLITKKNVDKFIECAKKNKKSKIKTILEDYKSNL